MKMKPIEIKGATKARTHRETADEYANVILRRGRYRVAVCRDGLQWLFQRRRRHIKPGGTAWDTLGYASEEGCERPLPNARLCPVCVALQKFLG